MKTILSTSFLLVLLVVTLCECNAQLVDSTLPIEVEADATGADARTGKVTFTNIAIRQGPLSIVADSAESSTLGFDDSTWTFQGGVKLSAPDSVLDANRMTLQFVNKRIQRATLTGSPLRYTDSSDAGTKVIARSADVRFSRNAIATVRLAGDPIELSREATGERKRIEGKAQEVSYDASTDNLELTGSAELGEGPNRITGNQITYNLGTRQVLAAANEQGEGRVHITINPSSDETPPDSESPDDETGDPADTPPTEPDEPPSSE